MPPGGEALMAYDIRPLSFGEILDRAFRVVLDNFALLFGIAAVVWLPSALLLVSGAVIGPVAASILYSLFLMIAAPVMHAALIDGVAEAYLGRPIEIGDAYQSIRPILWSYFGTLLLVGILFVIPGASIAGVAFMLGRPLFILAIILIGGAFIYFGVLLAFVAPVMIVERRFAMAALRRSRELVLSSWWRTVGILVTAGLIASVPAGTLKLLWGFIPFVGVILTAMTQAVSTTFSAVALMVYYFDRRCRVEDFDLRLLAEQVRSQSAPSMTPAPGSSSLA
jgi:hypothetical protein